MNGNRGQYTSAPLTGIKNKRPLPARPGENNGKQRKGNRRFGALAAMMALVLPALFLAALLIPNSIVRWTFLGVALAAVAFMWLVRAFGRNARNTLTVMYAALAVVIGLALFVDGQAPESRIASRMQDQGALFTNTDMGALNELLQNQATPGPTTPAANAVSAAQQRLEEFLVYWAQSNIPEMLNLCTPSWVSQQQSPESELYLNVVRNCRPTSYEIENVQGSDGDTSRTITLKATLDYQNGTEPTLNRLNVLMFRVNDVWYVDPQSLGGTPINETLAVSRTMPPNLGSTIAPTATPVPAGSIEATILYYNKDGGKYYHAVPNCSDVSEKYWPLDQFYYGELNSEKYKNLRRCETCKPLERPNLY